MPNIITPEFRLSFPHIFEPTSFEGGPLKYDLTMLFPKDRLENDADYRRQYAEMKKALENAILARYPNTSDMPANFRRPFRDGDTEAPDDPYRAGMIFVKASAPAKRKPAVVDRSRQPILSESEVYAGCWCRASVNPFVYDKAGNRGASYGLGNVQKLRDDEAFDGRTSPDMDFDDLDDPDGVGGESAAVDVSDLL